MNTPSNNHSTISPYFILCLAIVSVSTASLFIRFTQVEVPSLVIAAYRLSLATLITAAFIRSAHIEEIKHLTKREWLLLALSGLFLACHFAVWITSLNITSVASSVLLVTTTPLWVALLSPFLLAEKINSRTAFFLGIAFLGSVIVTFGKNYGSLQGSITCWMPSAGSARRFHGGWIYDFWEKIKENHQPGFLYPGCISHIFAFSHTYLFCFPTAIIWIYSNYVSLAIFISSYPPNIRTHCF
jgi:drug/metabolite transporter (DMT)-like permease